MTIEEFKKRVDEATKYASPSSPIKIVAMNSFGGISISDEFKINFYCPDCILEFVEEKEQQS